MINDDVRTGDIIYFNKSPSGFDGDHPFQVTLLGFPFDEGVRRNGGRVGAKDGPSSMRELMRKVGTVVNAELELDLRTISLFDVGDITDRSQTLEEAHQELRTRVGTLLDIEGVIPFVIGGGNDQSFPNGCALLDSLLKKGSKESIGVVNIDAHLDVRPLKDGKTHSGSPFRQLMEQGLKPKNFVEFAAQGNQCSAEHVRFLQDLGGKIIWLSSLRRDGTVARRFTEVLDQLSQEGPVFVSFDIDSIVGSDCPGVSAVATIGLTSQEALDMCFIAGRHPKVRLFDISEYNPVVEKYRTGRLVSNMFYYFCMGVSQRLKDHK